MHDNFEKEVQRKMEEMKLTPSAPVWQKIEVEIKAERKKRRGIFWLLLAGLLLAGGGWWGYQSLHKNQQQASSKIETPVKKRGSDKTPVSTQIYQQTNSSADVVDNHNNIDATRPQNRKPQNNSGYVINREKENRRGQVVKTVKQKKYRPTTDKERIVISPTPAEDKKTEKPIAGGKPQEAVTTIDKTTSTNSIDSLVVAKEQIPATIDSAVNPVIKKEEPPPVASDSLLKKKIAAANKKWKKQISVSIGRSSYQNYSSANSQLYYSSPLNGSGTTGNFAFNYPRPASAGFGFSTGFALVKQLNKKWELNVGLQYAYYSTQISVGDKKAMDTAVSFNMDKVAVDEFFTNTGNNNYTNRFHVVEIPVRLSYLPLHSLPLHISVGASYGRLLSTNALTYSRTSNLYYKNKKNYNPDYAPVMASVQYRFKSKKSFSIQTGPVIQYNLLKLQKEDITNIPHLFFAGLKTDIRF